jgi:hypothetical protein
VWAAASALNVTRIHGKRRGGRSREGLPGQGVEFACEQRGGNYALGSGILLEGGTSQYDRSRVLAWLEKDKGTHDRELRHAAKDLS